MGKQGGSLCTAIGRKIKRERERVCSFAIHTKTTITTTKRTVKKETNYNKEEERKAGNDNQSTN